MDKKFLKRIKRRDRLARWLITVGGMGIIFCVIFILFLIVRVSLPVFSAATAEISHRFAPADLAGTAEILAAGMDEYRETAFVIDRRGRFHFFVLADGRPLDVMSSEVPAGAAELAAASAADGLTYQLLWDDGSLTLERVRFHPSFAGGERTIEHRLERLGFFPPPPGSETPELSLARSDGDGGTTRVDLLPGNRLVIGQQRSTTDFLGNTAVEEFTVALADPLPGEITALVLDGSGQTLYAGTANGHLLRWSLAEAGEPELLDRLAAFADGRRITALGLVYGDISLAVGDERGGMTTWFPVRDKETREPSLQRIHTLEAHHAPVTRIIPSRRDKSLLSLDADGVLHLDHMTSERHLLALESPDPLASIAFSSRGDGIVALTRSGQGLVWAVDNPHPEVSLKTLFGKVWYESYDEPAYVWQSSAATDDFEPKLSLTPLIFGTMKGTFYAMLFAVPIAILAAIYTSQFSHPEIRKWVKPIVEVMAAIPSVIIGFLAALWLAPLLDRSLGGLFLSLIFIPGSLVVAILLWQLLRRSEPLQRVERGFEFLALVPVLILALALASWLGPVVEQAWFGGDIKLWLFSEWGTRYDQRNCIVIAFALGFAVIPIIFTIAEDALSNVPASIRAASLALGASRWQTVWRVILPSASPGIFAGTMIGFGRAVGETMIVLMATGNTAILDPSIFNGMRPLSSNIAVEIPEAPVDGSLYRVLFLSAVILFVLTFIVNTVAEVVRQRLRRKYGRF